MTTADPRIKLLTGPALALAKAAGFDAAVRLMVNFGGQRLYVPRKMRPHRPGKARRLNDVDFIGALGREAALQLAGLFGGEHIEIPIGTALKESQMRAAIAGFRGSNNEAVKAFGRHRRTIQRIRGDRPDDRQGALFGDASKQA